MFKGCASPLTIDWPQHYNYNHLGKTVFPDIDPVDTSAIQPEHASIALCRLVSEDPGRNLIVVLFSFNRIWHFGCHLMSNCSTVLQCDIIMLQRLHPV